MANNTESSVSYKVKINNDLTVKFSSFYNGESWNSEPEASLFFTQPNGDIVTCNLKELEIHQIFRVFSKITDLISCVPNRLNQDY